MSNHMITTIDNPYDPFTRFDEWYEFDESAGYHTTSYLARVMINSDALSEADQDLAHEAAIEEIVSENVLGIYRKVSQGSDDISSP